MAESLSDYLEHARTNADHAILRGTWGGGVVSIKQLPYGYEARMVEPLNRRLSSAQLGGKVIFDEKKEGFVFQHAGKASLRSNAGKPLT